MLEPEALTLRHFMVHTAANELLNIDVTLWRTLRLLFVRPGRLSHRGKVAADNLIERLRTLMALPTLKAIFAQLAVDAVISRRVAADGQTRWRVRPG